MIRIDLARLHQGLDFGNGDARGRRHHRVEVACGVPVDQVAGTIAFPGVHEREIGGDWLLEDVRSPVDQARFLSVGRDRAVSGRREEATDSRSSRTNPLGECPLGHQFHFDLALQELTLELLVLADVGGDHPADLVVLQEKANPEIVGSGVVADEHQIPRPPLGERADQQLRNAAQAEATHQD